MRHQGAEPKMEFYLLLEENQLWTLEINTRTLTPWNLLKRINDVKDAQMVLQMVKLCVCEKYFAATQNEICLCGA